MKNPHPELKGAKKAKRHHKEEAQAPKKKAKKTKESAEVTEMSIREKCDWIAELSEAVLENPSTAFSSSKTQENEEKAPSKMRQLLDLATISSRNGTSSSDEYTARLAILSLLALYQDVLPSYRIRLPTAAEQAVRVSKETKQMWDYERALLHHYQQYLKLLEKTWERNQSQSGKAPSSLAVACMLALCELLKSASHFNFRSNILTLVVRQMNNRSCEEVADACCQAVAHVFANDSQGEIALETARLVAKLVKDRQFRVRAAVLRVFLSLPLRVHVDEAEAAKLAAAAQAKKRKRNREEADIEKDLREGSSSVNKIILARCQSDTLQVVTLTYFKILKNENLTTSHIAELLPPALEGLAKFAHLINIDTVVDVLAVLKTLLHRVDELPLDASLNCVMTAFQMLQGPGREMKIDQKEYIAPLYSQLPRLCAESCSRKHTDLALTCLNLAFLKRREYSTVRIAAFCKQICTICLHAPPPTSVPLLAFVRQLIQRYPSVHQMLENEQDVITSGKYNPDVEDPEHSNPLATSAWELANLRFHVHPDVARQANGAAAQKLLQLPMESPERLRSAMVQDAEQMYIVTKRIKKKHPLASKNESKKKSQQFRFITPRKTAKHHLLSF